jgi:hypothetical protein
MVAGYGERGIEPAGSRSGREFLSELLLASEEELCSMKLISGT